MQKLSLKIFQVTIKLTTFFWKTEKLEIVSSFDNFVFVSLKLWGEKYQLVTGGHFACACVNPLNDNNVGASNLRAGNRKLTRKVKVLLKAFSLVLWIPYFPTKNILHNKNRTFSTRVFTCKFSAVGFLGLLKTLKTTPKSHVSV